MIRKLIINKPKVNIRPEKEKALEELAKVNAEIERLKNPTSKKPDKKKRIIREVLEAIIPFDTWSKLVQEWVEERNSIFKIGFYNESNRIDIVNQGNETYRITIMSFLGEEFIVSLFYTKKEAFNFKCIKVEYIKMDKLIQAIEFVYKSKALFGE